MGDAHASKEGARRWTWAVAGAITTIAMLAGGMVAMLSKASCWTLAPGDIRMMAPGNAAQRMFADPPKGGRFALEPWTAEGAAGRLAGTGAVGATLSGQFGACLGDIVRGPDPETFRASGTFTAADFPAMRAAADSQGSLQVSHRAVLDTGAPVAAQLAQGGLDLSGQRVVLLTGTSPLNFLGNALLWLARTGMLTRAVFVFESEDDCRRLEGVAPCWWHDPASWGDTFAAGVTGAVDRHCVLGANLNTVLSRPVKWFWAWQLMREGFDVVLMDPDVALFRNLVADDYGLWQDTWDVAGLSDAPMDGDSLAYCRFGPCLSTGLVFLKASPGALALVEASVGTMHSHGACPVAAVMRSRLGHRLAQDVVARLEMGQCLEWEQELLNDIARHDRLPMHVSVRELPRRFFANLPEALLASQPGTRDFAPFDMHVVHLGYMGNKEAVMWCVGLWKYDPRAVDPSLDWTQCPLVAQHPSLLTSTLQ